MEYHSDAVGILYAEEFGADEPVVQARTPSAPPPPPPEPPAPPPLTRADIAAACESAVGAARLAWAQNDAARRTAALETLAAGLSEIRAEAAVHAETVAEALAGAALAAVAAMLPHLAATHGLAELRALQATLLPALAHSVPVIVRVHPSLVDALQADVDEMGEDVAAQVELRPANLPVGDARMDWPDGSMTRNAASIQNAVIEGFSQLGMLPSGMPVQERELAHVQ